MKKYLCLIVTLMAMFSAQTTTAQVGLVSRVVKDGLFIPWEIVYGPDEHIWFTQKNGYICRLDPGTGHLDTVYREAQNVIIGEGGMLGMALHPSFATDPYVFVAYQYEDGSDYLERIVRFRYANNTLQNPLILLDHIEGAGIHNGCRLLIEGDKLFITTGDAANTSLPQQVSSLNGKVLRINLDGSIPADNPIPGNPVWSWGHRNAQGLAAHNGILYSSEHGPNTDDEVNIITAGRNYGWPVVRGFCNEPSEAQFCADSNVVEPLYAWTPTIAVSGMAYYNHPMFPSLANSLLMTTLKDNSLYQLKLNNDGSAITGVSTIAAADFGRLRDICIAPDGRIFVSTSNSNASGSIPGTDRIIELYDATATGIFNRYSGNDNLMVYPNPATDMMNIAFALPGIQQKEWQYAVTNMQGQVYQSGKLEFNTLHVGALYPGIYLLKMWYDNGQVTYKRFVKW
jgi:glucose/arabinose dehydrogenase